jgi:hypothetical protein
MKFILKDGFIYLVNNTAIANNKVVAEVDTRYVDDYKTKVFEYRINGGDYQKLQGSIVFEDKHYVNGHIDLQIRAKNEKETEYFKSDRIAVTYGVLFGDSIEKAYPEVIQHLIERMDRIDVVLTNVIDAMAEVDKKGNLL